MIRIAIADDHTLFAKGIEGLLEEHEDLEVLGLFSNGKELVDFLETSKVDVVLTDLNMPILNGFGVLSSVKEGNSQTKVIVLSMYDEEKIYKESIDKGADGFVLKDADPDELVFTIREVHEGRHVLNFDRVIEQARPNAFFDSFRDKYRLSRREIEIIKLIKEGLTNKDIAEELGLSQSTVETHRKNIHNKLGVSSRVELVNKAHEMNL
ncbi:MAG TPA: DNA-binding response regulator [Algoriphagus sp.]|jgi:DNA-binding NarL/FixJ family response regulator|uniref:Two component transcriptional regulator, LuxR family n=1 Tax=Algoriphagus ornithinivorans TaxID=226506 RepID=A0A1I5FTL6_9BACT|nr:MULTISPECIES: response regulator transcription factor [Algoriphagus]MAL16022.1 DNA-binding response regulator [Algoriphagus sp.]MAN89081.1 DNA-binding response regulator [Algoriphagus sp.]QYH40639.1 response regulator transcription factor [Algoriphagus sp. NBT04N3]SFO26923.1 two component transcriptional regulator, LuxR family [Algoriphagus ornithinivorans]HAD51852.1 DNA-binding response regulator [Algoriphagus sp.]|tara:strand:- start:684 stop:1310 length:627 start_codon:yes stop_codon:yes gene_type:complete